MLAVSRLTSSGLSSVRNALISLYLYSILVAFLALPAAGTSLLRFTAPVLACVAFPLLVGLTGPSGCAGPFSSSAFSALAALFVLATSQLRKAQLELLLFFRCC